MGGGLFSLGKIFHSHLIVISGVRANGILCAASYPSHLFPTLSPLHQEGEAYLQSQGMAVTEDDVKTRGQKEKLDEIEAEKPQVRTTCCAPSDNLWPLIGGHLIIWTFHLGTFFLPTNPLGGHKEGNASGDELGAACWALRGLVPGWCPLPLVL